MSVALTVDLDFFFDPILRTFSGTPLKSAQDRLEANSEQSLWVDGHLISEFNSYLRSLCGHACFHSVNEHNDALMHICEVMSAGRLSKPFTLINLDGHSDLYFTQLDEHYDQANDISCSQLPNLTDEASWVWVLHALQWIQKYVWIKPTPHFLSFSLPELPRSCVEAQCTEVMEWVKQKSTTQSWVDEMYDGKQPKLLEKSFHRLIATRFGRSFDIEVCKLDLHSLPIETVRCVTICRSPGFTPEKSDYLYDRILASIPIT